MSHHLVPCKALGPTSGRRRDGRSSFPLSSGHSPRLPAILLDQRTTTAIETMPALFNWLSRRRSAGPQTSASGQASPASQTRRGRRAPSASSPGPAGQLSGPGAGPRYAGYEETMAAAWRRLPAEYPISYAKYPTRYEEALAAAPLPSEPPAYQTVVNDWPYRYPERVERDGTPIPPAPEYPHDAEREREADPQLQPLPTYPQAIAAMSSTLEQEVDRYVRNMRTGLAKECLLPFPSEADVLVSGGTRTDRGRAMALVRSTRLARQAELLQIHQRELARLPQRLQRLRQLDADPRIMDRLDSVYASALESYGFFESEHQRLARHSDDSAQRASLQDGDIPLHRWGKTQGEALLLEAIHLYASMRAELNLEFSVPLPRVRGFRARAFLPRWRRNELRFVRSARLERQGELLDQYFGRMRQLAERRMREEGSLNAGPSLLDEIDTTLDEMWEFYVPFRIEHDRQLSRQLSR